MERLYLGDDGWIVKGATALLARDLGMRATVDVDLYRATAAGIAEGDLREAVRKLIVAARRYRGRDGVAVFSEDAGWRLVVETGRSLAFIRGSGQPMIESTAEVAAGMLEGLASNNGVLIDFFERDRVA